MADVLERDAGFCSGGDDDDIEAEDGIHSPTDASEDSVDVKVQAISFRNRNKRKCAEPRKVDSDLPAKKRKIDLTGTGAEATTPVESAQRNPFRPWSASPPPSARHRPDTPVYRIQVPGLTVRHGFETTAKCPETRVPHLDFQHPQPLPPVLTPHPRLTPEPGYHPVYHQDEPLSLVSKRRTREEDGDDGGQDAATDATNLTKARHPTDVRVPPPSPLVWYSVPQTGVISSPTDRESYHATTRDGKSAVPRKPLAGDRKSKPDARTKPENETHSQPSDSKFRIDSLLSSARADGTVSGTATAATTTPTPTSSSSTTTPVKSSQSGQQRNYKNMTRERRIEANARERTRVHTISAAFDTLRHSIPAYSHNQKLSKLSVLRIACSYIMTLSRLAGHDYSRDQSEPDLSTCVDNVSRTIQTEGKIRKKRDD